MGMKRREDMERSPQLLGVCFFIHSFIHSFNRHLLSTYYVLRPGDMATTVTSHRSQAYSLSTITPTLST